MYSVLIHQCLWDSLQVEPQGHENVKKKSTLERGIEGDLEKSLTDTETSVLL